MDNCHPKEIAYATMCADLVHPGHLHIIRTAREYGAVVIGLLTDEAIASYKAPPVLPYAYRRVIVENLKGVAAVVPQDTIDPTTNLRRLRPSFVVHADDWQSGPETAIRQRVLSVITEWGGILIEPAYLPGISSAAIRERASQGMRVTTAVYHQQPAPASTGPSSKTDARAEAPMASV